MSVVPDVLRSTALFGGLTDEELAEVQSLLREQRFLPGDVVLREGAVDEAGMWIILEGEAEVRKGGNRVHIFRPGDYFGELSVLSDPKVPRSADVLALGRLKAAELRQEDLMNLLRTRPGVGISMLAELARRLRRTTGRLEEMQRPEAGTAQARRSPLQEDDQFASIARGAISPPISRFGPIQE